MTTNDLVRGGVYRATTARVTTSGEYLGMEAPYGELAILLRRGGHTSSVDVVDIRAIAAV